MTNENAKTVIDGQVVNAGSSITPTASSLSTRLLRMLMPVRGNKNGKPHKDIYLKSSTLLVTSNTASSGKENEN